MELVHAPVPELKNLLTQSFEGWAQEGRSCALSGGATALIFLPALRAAKVDWARMTLFWADERAVPADDPESNYGIAERMLLSPLGAKAPRAIRMPADLPNLGDAALKYDDVLAAELEGRALDLALLGVGEDGHVASIFKGAQGAQGAEGAQSPELRVMAVEDAPKPPKRRLSLTLSYLLQTRKTWVVAVGPRKLPVLQAALSKTQRSTALDLVLHQVKDVTVFTDQVIRRR
jgi:6-phosphogluconolactonase